jgi:hypothetical protein
MFYISISALLATILIVGAVCLEVWKSQVICWSLFLMFSVLAAAWGFVSIEATKPFTETELLVLRVFVAVCGLLAIGFFGLAVRARK